MAEKPRPAAWAAGGGGTAVLAGPPSLPAGFGFRPADAELAMLLLNLGTGGGIPVLPFPVATLPAQPGLANVMALPLDVIADCWRASVSRHPHTAPVTALFDCEPEDLTQGPSHAAYYFVSTQDGRLQGGGGRVQRRKGGGVLPGDEGPQVVRTFPGGPHWQFQVTKWLHCCCLDAKQGQWAVAEGAGCPGATSTPWPGVRRRKEQVVSDCACDVLVGRSTVTTTEGGGWCMHEFFVQKLAPSLRCVPPVHPADTVPPVHPGDTVPPGHQRLGLDLLWSACGDGSTHGAKPVSGSQQEQRRLVLCKLEPKAPIPRCRAPQELTPIPSPGQQQQQQQPLALCPVRGRQAQPAPSLFSAPSSGNASFHGAITRDLVIPPRPGLPSQHGAAHGIPEGTAGQGLGIPPLELSPGGSLASRPGEGHATAATAGGGASWQAQSATMPAHGEGSAGAPDSGFVGDHPGRGAQRQPKDRVPELPGHVEAHPGVVPVPVQSAAGGAGAVMQQLGQGSSFGAGESGAGDPGCPGPSAARDILAQVQASEQQKEPAVVGLRQGSDLGDEDLESLYNSLDNLDNFFGEVLENAAVFKRCGKHLQVSWYRKAGTAIASAFKRLGGLFAKVGTKSKTRFRC